MRRRSLGVVLICSPWVAFLSFPASAHHQKQVSCEVYSYLDESGVFTQTVDADRIPAKARDRVQIERNCQLAHDISHAGGLVHPLSGGQLHADRGWIPWVAGAGGLLVVSVAIIILYRLRKSRQG
ncbi:MAG: hypothetical protein GYA21_09255 [Myxococcales bacterium]|nr:hypothetical protein [Myxococcales bacterium]